MNWNNKDLRCLSTTDFRRRLITMLLFHDEVIILAIEIYSSTPIIIMSFCCGRSIRSFRLFLPAIHI